MAPFNGTPYVANKGVKHAGNHGLEIEHKQGLEQVLEHHLSPLKRSGFFLDVGNFLSQMHNLVTILRFER